MNMCMLLNFVMTIGIYFLQIPKLQSVRPLYHYLYCMNGKIMHFLFLLKDDSQGKKL